jgi:hypothetical protein
MNETGLMWLNAETYKKHKQIQAIPSKFAHLFGDATGPKTKSAPKNTSLRQIGHQKNFFPPLNWFDSMDDWHVVSFPQFIYPFSYPALTVAESRESLILRATKKAMSKTMPNIGLHSIIELSQLVSDLNPKTYPAL